MRRVARAAIVYDGLLYTMEPPSRHHHIIHGIASFLGVECLGEMDQGFVDEAGVFLTRAEALQVATAAGQLKPDEPVRAGVLFSENVW